MTNEASRAPTPERLAAARLRAIALLSHDDEEGVPDPNSCETCIGRLTSNEVAHAAEVEVLDSLITARRSRPLCKKRFRRYKYGMTTAPLRRVCPVKLDFARTKESFSWT